jgi:hypothetical protein
MNLVKEGGDREEIVAMFDIILVIITLNAEAEMTKED